MPLHLCPNNPFQSTVDRRHFLRSAATVAASVVVLNSRKLQAEDSQLDSNFFALLSDTHIPESPEVTARGVNMTENLRNVVAQLGRFSKRPANVLVNGDCAYLKGLAADYRNFAQCLSPLEEQGMTLHITMGNHDDRGPLYAELAKLRPAQLPVASKHVSVIESEFANWFLLDSLFAVNVVTGQLGKAQLTWLATELERRSEKPAIVMLHHNPQFVPPADGKPWNGIEDTDGLFEVLRDRKQVKAVIFGHTHNYSEQQHGAIRLINLPPVAYVFADGQPNGWIEAHLASSGLHLKLHTHDPKHRSSQQVIEVKWG